MSLKDLKSSIDEFKERAMNELRQLENVDFRIENIQKEQDELGKRYESQLSLIHI